MCVCVERERERRSLVFSFFVSMVDSERDEMEMQTIPKKEGTDRAESGEDIEQMENKEEPKEIDQEAGKDTDEDEQESEKKENKKKESESNDEEAGDSKEGKQEIDKAGTNCCGRWLAGHFKLTALLIFVVSIFVASGARDFTLNTDPPRGRSPYAITGSERTSRLDSYFFAK